MEGGASHQQRYICVFPKAQRQDRILPQMRPLRPSLQAKLAGQVAQLPEVSESRVTADGFPRRKWGPHKGEWPLWGEEEHGEQVELSVREAEHCSRRSDDGASRASGCPPAAPPTPKGRTGRQPGPTGRFTYEILHKRRMTSFLRTRCRNKGGGQFPPPASHRPATPGEFPYGRKDFSKALLVLPVGVDFATEIAPRRLKTGFA